jgi:hydrogenase/urease accessory protein HupE
MLVAVLVLAVFGLWSLVAVALVLACWIWPVKVWQTVAEGVNIALEEEQLPGELVESRLACSVCGAHLFESVPASPGD